jgi:hypothetical protein
VPSKAIREAVVPEEHTREAVVPEVSTREAVVPEVVTTEGLITGVAITTMVEVRTSSSADTSGSLTTPIRMAIILTITPTTILIRIRAIPTPMTSLLSILSKSNLHTGITARIQKVITRTSRAVRGAGRV